MVYARIAGTGGYLPQRVVTNTDLESRIDTSDEWIVSRTGIEARHVAADGETTCDLAAAAARAALQAAGLEAADIDGIVVATTTPDMVFPSTACLVQARLGVPPGPAFDVQAVCAGFVYALSVADAMIRTGQCRRMLVIGAEVFSRLLDWSDRRTCVLFGDGAGAVVLERGDQPGMLHTVLRADGRQAGILEVPVGLSGGELSGHPYLQMDGAAVFRFAVKNLGDLAEQVLREAELPAAQLDWLIPHQANGRIIDALAQRLKRPADKVVSTVARHGNTSAASVPLALDTAVRDGRVQPGHSVLLLGVGGGMTWGGVLLRY